MASRKEVLTYVCFWRTQSQALRIAKNWQWWIESPEGAIHLPRVRTGWIDLARNNYYNYCCLVLLLHVQQW